MFNLLSANAFNLVSSTISLFGKELKCCRFILQGFEPMIEASEGGLPVDLTQVCVGVDLVVTRACI